MIETMAEAAQRVAADAPPLTPEQAARIGATFRAGREPAAAQAA